MPQKKIPKKIPLHPRVMKFIRTVRASFPDAAIIFTHGACYGFSQILIAAFPSGKSYATENVSHIVTKIDGRFYDIYGEYLKPDGTQPQKVTPLTSQQHEIWESNASGQRVEYMLKKYRK